MEEGVCVAFEDVMEMEFQTVGIQLAHRKVIVPEGRYRHT
jgi:hypothetical protein